MKKLFSMLLVAWICALSYAQATEQAELKVHFTFSSLNSAVGGYTGTLRGGASLTTAAGLPVLALGPNDGYFDMGASVGEVIATLNDFTISTNVYVPGTTALGANGNFIYTFANSTNIAGDANGCIFFGANETRYTICLTNYKAEENVIANYRFPTGAWHTLTYRQTGNVGELFLDGVEVATNTIPINPSQLGATPYNFLGCPCYVGDVYLKDAQYNDFRIYDGAVSDATVAELTQNTAALNGELYMAQIDALMERVTLEETVLYNDISLPTPNSNGITVTWSSSDESVVSSTGVVNRPAYGNGDATVILTATFSKGGISKQKTFTVTVPAAKDDSASVEADINAIDIKGHLDNLMANLYLPTTGHEGSTIAWTSSMPEYLSHEGELLKQSAGGKQHVQLTAKVSKGTASRTKTWDIYIARKQQMEYYLFAYFNGNAQWQEQICFALSTDGYNYTPLNNGSPIINSADISLKHAVRDPHILRGEDGYFYMVVTDMRSSQGWSSNDGMVLLRSADMVNWTHTAIDFPSRWPERFDRDALTQVWAPQTIYDPEEGKYMVYYAIGESGKNYITYYSYANEDFTDLTEPQVLYNHGGNNTIDADIVWHNGQYHMFFKTEGQGNGIQKATARTLRGKWTPGYKYLQQTSVAVEGSGVFKLIDSDTWVLMYDCYTSGMYEYCTSTDLNNFTKVCNSANTSIFTPRHGTTIAITAEEAERLVQKWPSDGLELNTWTDITDFCVESPRFDGNSSNGWDVVSNAEGINRNYGAMEFWNGHFNLSQTIHVPNGKYRLSAQAFYNTAGSEDAYLYANEVYQPIVKRNDEGAEYDGIGNCDMVIIDGSVRYVPVNMRTGAFCFEQGVYNNSLTVEVTDGTLTFGLICEEYTPENWCMFDNFKLEYQGSLVPVEKIVLSHSTINLNVGENAAITATTYPEEALCPGLMWLSTDEEVVTVDQNGNIRAHGEGNAFIVVKLADGSSVQAQCAVTVSELQGSWIDVTNAYIVNPGFDNNSKTGWSINSNAGSQVTGNEAMEFWNGRFDIYQTVYVPNGKYRLSVQAYYRTTNNEPGFWDYLNGTENITGYLYGNAQRQQLVSIYAEGLTSQGLGRYFVQDYVDGQQHFHPDDMTAGAYCFSQGMYNNSVIVDVTDGTLTFGLVCESNQNGNWCMMDNFKLEYYGTLIPVTSITLSQETLKMNCNESVTLTATVHPDNATYQGVVWTSDNPRVAQVDQQGTVTAFQSGTATISASATDESGCVATCQVTVADNKVTVGSILINEIQAANIDMFVDPSFNYGGWVELYNATDLPLNLNYFYMSDDATNLKKFNLGLCGTLPAGGYKVLWFDHHHYTYAPSQVNFKLDYDGGAVYLSDAEGNLIVSQEYPMAVPRTSYARTTDGTGEWGRTAEPTPGKSNATSTFATERLEAPVVDTDAMLFTAPFTFNVSIPKGATLRYTTDGTTPTLTNGATSADGKFSVSNTAIYRFCLFQEGKLPSQVVTRSFLYKDREYTLPIISVVTDPVNLYDDSLGVYVQGVNGRTGNGQSMPCNWNMDWDRPVNFEYITPDGGMVVNQEVDFAMCGGWSRAWTPHSFKLKATKIYEGNNSIDYPFFADKPYLKHKTLQIRNGGNDIDCRIKDPALQEIVHRSGLDVDGQSTQPVVHFINGRYVSMLNMREPNNKHFAYANWGIDTDEMDQFEMSPDSGYVQMEGDREAFLEWYALSANAADEATYEEIRSLVDIDEYINYMAVEFYLGGNDWPQNNIKGFRPRTEGGRFRFVMFDLDGTLATTSPFYTFEGKQTYTFDPIFDLGGGRLTEEIELVTIFLNMLSNDSFRKQFIDTYCLVAGSVFEPERCNAIIDEMAARIAPMLAYDGKSPYGTANQLKSALRGRQAPMIRALIDYWRMGLSTDMKREITLSANVEGAALRVNDMEVPTGRFSGTLFAPVTLKAEPKAGYRFVGWSSESSTVQSTLIAKNSTWNYYDQGSLDGKSWTASSYSTTSWGSGKAPLGYASNNNVYNTTLDYGTDGSNKRPTYYFRTTFKLTDAPGTADRFVMNYTVDDGMVVYVNGKEAARYLMPNGTVSYGTYASSHATGNPDSGTLTLPAELFKKGTNTIAVEVHNNSGSSSDIYFDCELQHATTDVTGNIVSEEPEYTPTGNATLIAVYEPLTAEEDSRPVRINELSADNSIYINEYYKKNDWIELYNTTDRPIDVAGMYLSDNLDEPTKYMIEGSGVSTVIEPYGYLVIWPDKLMTFTQLHAPFKLAAEGGYVTLTDADCTWRDVLYYEPHLGIESVGLYPDGSSDVYVMATPTIAETNIINSYAAWLEQPEIPELPGRPDDGEGIEGVVADGLQLLFANNTLYIDSPSAATATVVLYTPAGRQCLRVTVELTEGRANINLSTVVEGTYFAAVSDSEGNVKTLKLRIK